jgi:hypothetical protein
MGLNDWFNDTLKKEHCPKECVFKKKKDLRSRPIVFIPPPEKPKIMLISRDPPVTFRPFYEYAMSHKYDEKPNERRLMLFACGIPNGLIYRIVRFREKEDAKIDVDNLFRIFEIAYWTHLHKCPTDNEAKFSKKCAKKWLEEEIKEAVEEGVKTVVGLGRTVEDWLKKANVKASSKVNIICLPHPSGRNRAWEDVEKKGDIEKRIKDLIDRI